MGSWAKFWCALFPRPCLIDFLTPRRTTYQVQDGQKNIPVGQVIALLAEEGDDISNIEVPTDEPTPSKPVPAPKQEYAPAPPQTAPTPTPAPKVTHHISHSRPLFPSVARLLQVYNVQDPEQIKGTGVRGMLTKGDVLAFLGKASSPTGTFIPTQLMPGSEAPQKAEVKVEKVRSINFYVIPGTQLNTMLATRWARNSSTYCPKHVSDRGQGARWSRWVHLPFLPYHVFEI
jgi:pyruvate/2-oxoglutarate dehydrogenase complex dihydrolipoamide acyltransferase (E2) component